jgi:hypothetical protein
MERSQTNSLNVASNISHRTFNYEANVACFMNSFCMEIISALKLLEAPL